MRTLLAAVLMLAAAAAYAQTGGSASSGGGSSTMGGGVSQGRDTTGGSRMPDRSGGEQAQVPDVCEGDRCAGIGEPTGTGLGDRGIGRSTTRPYDLRDSPVEGGPAVTGPTGRPIDVPHPGRRDSSQ